MALLSKKEFAAECGMITKKLSVYIQREKVFLTEDKIDTENPINAAFREKMKSKKPSVNQEIPVKEEQTKPKKDKNTSKSSEDYTSLRKHLDRKQELETSKLEEEAERMRTQTRILRLQEERALGKMVPTDVIKGLFAQHFKSMTTSFKDAIDVIVLDFAKRAKLNRNEIAEFKGELIVALNSATGNAITMSTKQIGAIVTEYSQAKK